MSKKPNIPTVKRLFAISGNLCAFPQCPTPIIDPSSNVVIGEICHIKAREEGGARYDPSQTDEERNAFENLILLCSVHHKIVDTDENAYPVKRLTEIKAAHEGKFSYGAEPAEEIVQRLIVKTYFAGSAIKTVHQTGGQAAHLINNYIYHQSTQPLTPYHIAATAPASNPLFTGRRYHLNKLIKSFTCESPAGYTIHGMGGVGKTEVAKKLATELMSFFTGGIFWGALSDHDGNPTPILHYWGRLCAVELPPGLDADSLAHLVRGILSARQAEKGRLLIIIDDMREKWLDAAKLLRTAVPGITSLLVTARNEMLAQAMNTLAYHLNEMEPKEALQALNVYSIPYKIKDEMNTAESLLKVVGYLPLAIELAGKRLAFLSRKPGTHLKDLHTAVEMRAVETLTIPGHKGLAATFLVTYESLSKEEQRIFRWLSAFAAGPIDVVSVAEIIQSDLSVVESLLDNLVASSLLQWGETKGKYTLHSLLKQYSEKLLDNNATESKESRQCHLNYYLARTENNAENSPIAHAVLEADLPNILKAIDFAFNSEQFESVNKIVLDLWTESGFLSMRGYMKLGLELSQRALIACRKLGDRANESSHLSHIGYIHHHLGFTEESYKYSNQALAISREIGNRYVECAQLHNLGLLYKDVGNLESAMECYQQAINIAFEIKDSEVALDALSSLASAHLHLGNTKSAKKIYEELISLARKLGDRHREGNALSNLGLVYGDLMGAYEIAFAYFAHALTISLKIGDRTGEGNRLNHLANIFLRFNKPEMSISYLKDSLKISRETGHRAHEAAQLLNLGNVYRYMGQVTTAITYYTEALSISKESGYQDSQGSCLANLGITYRDLGQIERSRQYLEQAVTLYKSTKSQRLKEVEDLLSSLSV
jgi:tetratricopeptide (TPR) repeat protein